MALQESNMQLIIEKKRYNQEYYAKNKERIAKMLYEKMKCPKCRRIINYQRMAKHQQTKYCQKRNTAGEEDEELTRKSAQLRRLMRETDFLRARELKIVQENFTTRDPKRKLENIHRQISARRQMLYDIVTLM